MAPSGCSEQDVALAGLETIQGDQDFTACNKQRAGGLAAFSNGRWCHLGNISVEKHACCSNLYPLHCAKKLLGLGNLTCHYCNSLHLPICKPTAACDVIHGAATEFQTSSSNTLITISRDFNHNMDNTPTTFTQYVQLGRETSWTCLWPTLRKHTALQPYPLSKIRPRVCTGPTC